MQSINLKPSSKCCSSVRCLISKLKSQLGKASLEQRTHFIANHQINWADVQRHIHRDPCGYHREIVETNELFQLLFITWLSGQKSPIHNHRGSQCVVRVINGIATETVYKPNDDRTYSRESSIYRSGTTIGGEDADIHTIENPESAKQDLVTMHVYFPPLKQMDLFAVRNDKLVQLAL